MPPKKPLKRDELIRRLRRFKIEILKKRGKGSEIILLQPDTPGSQKGEIFTLTDHGKKTEYAVQVVSAILRRFQIDADEFWD